MTEYPQPMLDMQALAQKHKLRFNCEYYVQGQYNVHMWRVFVRNYGMYPPLDQVAISDPFLTLDDALKDARDKTKEAIREG